MKTHTKSIIRLAIAMLALAPLTAISLRAEDKTATTPAAPTLKIGDPAPGFKVTGWYKGDPVTLDETKTYIVECWATWCGPCIAAFPHLSALAKANEGKPTVIGVNVWERKKPEEVTGFVEAQGDKMSYLVAADGDGVIAKGWLKAAGRTGIPCAFVVNKGKMAWIGHPAKLEQKLLDSIIGGTFDMAAFAKAQEREEAAGRYFNQNVMPLLRNKDTAGAIGALEKMMTAFPDQEKNIQSHIERLKVHLPKETPRADPHCHLS